MFMLTHREPINPINAGKFTARPLDASDSEAFKAIRLEALKNEGHLFGPMFEDVIRLPEEFWSRTCTPTRDNCLFGLFENRSSTSEDKLIGIMGAKRWDKDPAGETALWWTAFVQKEYRGFGLAGPLYEVREAWTKKYFKKAVFYICEDNEKSAEIHEKHWAKCTHNELIEWPNRPTVPWRWYEKQLNH